MKFEPVSRARLVSGSRVGALGGSKCPICDHNEWRGAEDVVVANVYFNGHWYDMTIFHVGCYLVGGRGYSPEQYGPAGTAEEYEKALVSCTSSRRRRKSLSINRR